MWATTPYFLPTPRLHELFVSTNSTLFFFFFSLHMLYNLYKYTQKRKLKHTENLRNERLKNKVTAFMRAIAQRLLFNSYTPITQTRTTTTTNCIRKIIMSASDQSSCFNRPRLIVKKVLAKPQREGDGAVVRRSIGRPELKSLDPFLLLDEFAVSSPGGFPDHPHRGFETVTYMLQGAFTHQDFAGHRGTIHTGDVQWMTAGRGIIHSEMPAGEGTQKGLQLWINLASKDKMIEPRYQELLSEDIAKAKKDGVEVRIIAGEAMGVESPVYTRTPTMYLDFTLRPGAQLHQSIPESWNAFVYIIEGEDGGVFGSFNSSPVMAHHVLVLSPGDGLSVWNKSSSKPLRFVLIGGQPLNEPVVQYGPFVMNTQAEIEQTFLDYQYCKNGFENAKQWRSQSTG